MLINFAEVQSHLMNLKQRYYAKNLILCFRGIRLHALSHSLTDYCLPFHVLSLCAWQQQSIICSVCCLFFEAPAMSMRCSALLAVSLYYFYFNSQCVNIALLNIKAGQQGHISLLSTSEKLCYDVLLSQKNAALLCSFRQLLELSKFGYVETKWAQLFAKLLSYAEAFLAMFYKAAHISCQVLSRE